MERPPHLNPPATAACDASAAAIARSSVYALSTLPDGRIVAGRADGSLAVCPHRAILDRISGQTASSSVARFAALASPVLALQSVGESRVAWCARSPRRHAPPLRSWTRFRTQRPRHRRGRRGHCGPGVPSQPGDPREGGAPAGQPRAARGAGPGLARRNSNGAGTVAASVCVRAAPDSPAPLRPAGRFSGRRAGTGLRPPQPRPRLPALGRVAVRAPGEGRSGASDAGPLPPPSPPQRIEGPARALHCPAVALSWRQGEPTGRWPCGVRAAPLCGPTPPCLYPLDKTEWAHRSPDESRAHAPTPPCGDVVRPAACCSRCGPSAQCPRARPVSPPPRPPASTR